MTRFKNEIPEGFTHPTAYPQTTREFSKWQKANQLWWDEHPMRYDWKDSIRAPEFTREFYEEIDKRFFSSVKDYMPWKRIPFDSLINFDLLKNQDVLEIGVGSGSHAQLLATHAGSFRGIDISDYAVRSTSERMLRFSLKANIDRMEAERLSFEDEAFDFVWSWGVIHHTSDPERVLSEMCRVLRPGGYAVTMVYHRNFWNYYVAGGLFHGVFKGDLFKTKSLHKTVQRTTDGAIARFYTISEWTEMIQKYFALNRILIFGNKAEVLLLPRGPLKDKVMNLIPNRFSRFLTNRLKWGTFLVSILKKR